MKSFDRVRAHTPAEINARIDQSAYAQIQHHAGSDPAIITKRIRALEREWDIERWLETNASILGLTGLILGLTRGRKWLVLPGVVFPFLLQHALQGWCPPVSLFRRLGVRTRREIEAERYALKALRGDFIASIGADQAIRAVRIR